MCYLFGKFFPEKHKYHLPPPGGKECSSPPKETWSSLTHPGRKQNISELGQCKLSPEDWSQQGTQHVFPWVQAKHPTSLPTGGLPRSKATEETIANGVGSLSESSKGGWGEGSVIKPLHKHRDQCFNHQHPHKSQPVISGLRRQRLPRLTG